ncbi:MAG: hypothetical protein IPP58_07695 [Holophagaceae bacterium]|uniref:PKD domain-containing protein n=1 Tax=Candidatus Geothrix skivensis TaxID=2954439 RepID=A0A9D7XHQ9_9BACT|nr:hypothetical protein [Candidatus Geothrix skivensis]
MAVALVGAPSDVISGDSASVTAQVQGSTNTAVTWTVEGIQNGNSTVGTISGSGNTVTYVAPANEGNYTLAAISVADATKSARSTIRVHHIAALLAPTINAPSVAAPGATGLPASVTNPQARVSYSWTILGGTIQGASTGTAVTFSAGQAGTLNLTCRATLDTQVANATAQVQVQGTAPRVPQITAPTSASAGATNLTATVAQPEAGTSYQWTIVGGTITAGAATPSATFTAGSVGTLTLTCRATNTVGSTSAQAQVQVVTQAPTTPVITAPSQVTAQSGNNLASIPAQAGCTYNWTISGGTISSGQGTTNLTFAAGAAGTLVLGCTVTNSASVSASAQKNIAILPAPVQTAGYYGSNLNGDDIGNIVIGWNTANDNMNRVASYRFRALHTGAIQAIRPFYIWSGARAGYALGNGGDIQIQIQTDDGTSSHNPSGTVLASLVNHAPVPVPQSSGTNYYPLLTFSSPAQVTAGQLYHIVFSNITADPKANWVSLDCIWMASAFSQEQPTLPNTDMAILEKNSAGAWVKFSRGSNTGYTPCYELDYADGASQGQGYLGAFAYPDGSFVNPKPISGTQAVRQTMTVSGSDRVATSVSVRVRYSSGPSPLTIRVEKADGTLVGQGTVANIPVTPGNVGEAWAKLTFITPITLAAGQSYNLVMSAPSDSVYTTHSLYKGMNSGYKPTTYFGDGHAEFNNGSGWKRWDAWGVQNRLDNDLQFFFELQ